MSRLILPRAVLGARMLFWVQIGVGVIAGLGVTVGFKILGQVGSWAAAAAVLGLAWLVAAVATLLVLERRKPLLPPQVDARVWARHVGELRASRMGIVAAFEIERRRIERDLHDGTQQYLVAAAMKVGEAVLLLDADKSDTSQQIKSLLAHAQDATEAALSALRTTVAGIHPAVLSDLGLETAVRDLADRGAVDVDVRVPHPLPAMPDAVAAAAYFLVAEALTNVAKHAPEAHTTVLLAADDRLHISIVDDGPGGASVRSRHGLAGMTERLAAFGATLTLASPAGGPTSLNARVPLLLEGDHPRVVHPATARQRSR